MKNLIIIGARGWGREVLWAAQSYVDKGLIAIKGFLDDNTHAFDGLVGEFPPILSSVEDYEVQPDDLFFCALGDPVMRQKYSRMIEDKGGEFGTYISPKASVSPNAVIGAGSYIDEYVCVSDNVTVGKHAIVQRMATIGHDTRIDDYVTLGAYTFVGGASSIGTCSVVNPHSTVLRQKSVGTHAVVGAGSVVIRRVKDGEHVFGNPARVFMESQ